MFFLSISQPAPPKYVQIQLPLMYSLFRNLVQNDVQRVLFVQKLVLFGKNHSFVDLLPLAALASKAEFIQFVREDIFLKP